MLRQWKGSLAMKIEHLILASALLLGLGCIKSVVQQAQAALQMQQQQESASDLASFQGKSPTPSITLVAGNVSNKECSLPHPNYIRSTAAFLNSSAAELKLGQAPTEVRKLVKVKADGDELIEERDPQWSKYIWTKQDKNIETKIDADFNQEQELAEVSLKVVKNTQGSKQENCQWRFELK